MGEVVAVSGGGATIGLFGVTGRTGKEFAWLALERGHHVTALVRTPSKVSIQNERLKLVQGDLTRNDDSVIEQVVQGADYVVCMLAASTPRSTKDETNDNNGSLSSYPQDFMLRFVERLCAVLERTKPKVLLFQAGSMSSDGNGYLHPIAWTMKHTLGRKLGIFPKIHDNNAAIQHIAAHHSHNNFHFIVTRAGVLKEEDDSPSPNDNGNKKKVVASNWPPLPMFPVTYADLAEFSLSALTDESLYDTYPFVR